MSGATSGPWRAEGGLVRGPRQELVAQCVTEPGLMSPEAEVQRNETNAVLIASTPAMAEKIKTLQALVNAFNDRPAVLAMTEEWKAMEAALAAARDALAEAKAVLETGSVGFATRAWDVLDAALAASRAEVKP